MSDDEGIADQQDIILDMEPGGTVAPCINQKAPLMSHLLQQVPDLVAGLEGKTVVCEDVTFRLSTSFPILEGCLTATCVQCENDKSISSIRSSQSSIARGAKTDSDRGGTGLSGSSSGRPGPAGRAHTWTGRRPGTGVIYPDYERQLSQIG